MISRAALVCVIGFAWPGVVLAQPTGSQEDATQGSKDPEAEPASEDEEAPDDEEASDDKLDAPPEAAARKGPRLSPLNPRPEEFPKDAPAEAPPSLAELLSDIATLRSRVAALTTSLYASQLKVFVAAEGDDSRIASLVVTLDDGVVFSNEESFVADETRQVYEHAVAPGRHVLGIEVERYDARSKSFRTWQTTRLAIEVPENEKLEVDLVLEDDSDMAEEFPDDQDGEYDLRVRARALVVE